MSFWLMLLAYRADVKQVLPKIAIGQAVSYLRNQWSSLQLYLHNGRLPIDNNQSERTIRPLMIGRKNWLFLGSAEAAPGRMKLFSVINSAQRQCLSIQDCWKTSFFACPMHHNTIRSNQRTPILADFGKFLHAYLGRLPLVREYIHGSSLRSDQIRHALASFSTFSG